MAIQYLGTLNSYDPLYDILLEQVYPDVKSPIIHVNKMSSKRVYKYTEEKSRISIIGKFFRLNDPQQDRLLRKKAEFDNLTKIRSYGFDKYPLYVVRPINREEKIGLALTEEFISGKDLDYYLKKAVFENKKDILKDKLSRLAKFLHEFHRKTAMNCNVDLDSVITYFQKILNKLYIQTVISKGDRLLYLKFMDKWINKGLRQNVKSVIIHGDATPTNFIFMESGNVVAIDLERMRYSDSVFDVGMVCGELKHAFMWRTGNSYASEPFISHFLKSYSSHFKNVAREFREITFRNPFYMALTELRIARNNYLDWNYRKRLAFEAMECLRWGLKLK